MQLTLIDIVFIAVLVAQIMIGVIALWGMRGMARRFAHPLGSKTTMVELLEKYSRIFAPINIKVDAKVPQPAIALGDTLLVNKKAVYSANLFPNFVALFQIQLLQPAYRLLKRGMTIQVSLFAVELLIFYLGFAVNILALRGIAVGMGIVLIISGFIYQSYLSDVLNDAYEVATDLLDLDEVERLRAGALVKEFQAQAFVYAAKPAVWLVRFIIPLK